MVWLIARIGAGRDSYLSAQLPASQTAQLSPQLHNTRGSAILAMPGARKEKPPPLPCIALKLRSFSQLFEGGERCKATLSRSPVLLRRRLPPLSKSMFYFPAVRRAATRLTRSPAAVLCWVVVGGGWLVVGG